MDKRPRKIVVFGLSISSSWGNGHATTYRALLRGLRQLGYDVTFCERDVPWYAENRDLPSPDFVRLELYSSLSEAAGRFSEAVRSADLVIVGSYVLQGIELAEWIRKTTDGVFAFYDIDTPITLAQLEGDRCEYVSRSLMPQFDLYLSFTGGPLLRRLEQAYGVRAAQPLYCSVDSDLHAPQGSEPIWDLGYMGTYSTDRQANLEQYLLAPARLDRSLRTVVAGSQYPASIVWPTNTQRIVHLPPHEHPNFYSRQKFTLNLTRQAMREVGYSPSVRLFEAAACGVPVISDVWPGLEKFFEPDAQILVARSTRDVVHFLSSIPENERRAIGARGRNRVLSQHTGVQRALELQSYVDELCRSGNWRHGDVHDDTVSEPRSACTGAGSSAGVVA
jgi:spore maturation protein CgeB